MFFEPDSVEVDACLEIHYSRHLSKVDKLDVLRQIYYLNVFIISDRFGLVVVQLFYELEVLFICIFYCLLLFNNSRLFSKGVRRWTLEFDVADDASG